MDSRAAVSVGEPGEWVKERPTDERPPGAEQLVWACAAGKGDLQGD